MVTCWTKFPACFAHPEFAHSVPLLQFWATNETVHSTSVNRCFCACIDFCEVETDVNRYGQLFRPLQDDAGRV